MEQRFPGNQGVSPAQEAASSPVPPALPSFIPPSSCVKDVKDVQAHYCRISIEKPNCDCLVPFYVLCKLLLNTTTPIRVKGGGFTKKKEGGVLCKETDMMHLGWYDQ